MAAIPCRSARSLLLAGCILAALPLAAAAASDKIIVLINPNSNPDTTASMTEIASTATGGVTV